MADVKPKEERNARLTEGDSLDFNLIKVGNRKIQNDVIALLEDASNQRKRRPFKQEDVYRAIDSHNYIELRRMSNVFFERSGIYSRLCRYMAYLFRYDWMIEPILFDTSVKTEKVIEGWYKASNMLENCRLKKLFGNIALDVVKNGCYYGLMVEQKNAVYLQKLPVNYCRTRYEVNGNPAVELNMRFFDEQFKDTPYRMRVLKLFPKDIQKAYVDYKNGKLPRDYAGDTAGWYLLDPEKCVKFNLSNTDMPLFISVIPAILDLEDAQDLDKKKMAQQLLRVIIQKVPLDKNFDLVFDMKEAESMHANAVNMLGDAVGVDVLTTFADIECIDLSDKGNVSSVDQLDKIERTVYNEAGVSQMQFNTSGNLALEKSIANDEATMTDLVLQFEQYIERVIKPFNKNPKRLLYRAVILPTTVYNYKDLSKIYKEQTTIGFSKLLPQVALGMSQTEIIATAIFENDMLGLDELFIPPQMSSTMSSADGGRPEKEDDTKSEETIRKIEKGYQ